MWKNIHLHLLPPAFELTIFSITSSCWDITFLKEIFISRIDNFDSQYLLGELSAVSKTTGYFAQSQYIQ